MGMRRLALLLFLVGLGAMVACEDDSKYSIGPSTFANDTLEGGAGAVGNADAAADVASGGTTGTGGTSGAAGTTGAAGTGAGGN